MELGKAQKDIVEYFFKNPNVLHAMKKKERDELCVLIFMLLELDLSTDMISKLVTILYNVCFVDSITIEEVWEILWNINKIIFSKQGVAIIGGDTRTLYTYIFKSLSEAVPCKHKYRVIEERNKDVIVITCSQMLGIGHAPTIRVLDYAYTLQHDLGKKVVIINDGGMNFIHNINLRGRLSFNYNRALDQITSIEYKGEEIRYIQNSEKMPSVSAILRLTDMIYEINPLLVYNIGAHSLVSDYCTYFTTTACLPCSFAVPVSCSKYLLVGRKVGDGDSNTIEQLLDYQYVIETNVNYQYHDNEVSYTRKQFGINQESFLIGIVGNRLDIEITLEFIELLNQILQEHKNVEVVMIGDINRPDRIKDKILENKRLHLVGNLKMAGEFIRCCNIYLNPKRNGGGRSSFEALHFGIPVITLKNGDVYHTCGEEFAVDTNEEILELVKGYIVDKEFYRHKSEAATNRAMILSDIEKTLSSAINNVMKNEGRNDE